MRQQLFCVLVIVLSVWIGLVAAEAQQELAATLAQLPNLVGEVELYPRQGQEDIYAIARRHGISASMVYNANAGDLQAGHELLLLPKRRLAPVRIASGVVVNLTERSLYWYEGGQALQFFPIAIGKRGWETPTGDFTIVNKAKNPTWFPPSWAVEEQPVPPGPDNPLGDRWMGLSVKGYGIHATNAPWTVGLYLSHGCMRMYPEHARDLYELVEVGTPVSIVYRRVVFGYSAEDGTVYMAYHPDPYPIGDFRAEQVRDMLQYYGLEGSVDMKAVARALAAPTGVPQPIIGSRTEVVVNGATVEMALGPTKVEGDWLVPAGPIAHALGATLEISPRRDYFVVKRGGDRIFFSPCCAEALLNGRMVKLEAAPQLAAGYPLIPLRSTVKLLGASWAWDEKRDQILVWNGGRVALSGAAFQDRLPSRDDTVSAPLGSSLR